MLGGRLTRDVELRYSPKGTACAELDLAINRKWKSETGEEKEEVTFVNVSVFGRAAENVAQYCRKGSTVFIEGRLRLETWDDKQTNQKRSKLKVVAESVQFVGSPKDAPSEAGAPAALQSAAKPAERTQTARELARSNAADDDGDDQNIPF